MKVVGVGNRLNHEKNGGENYLRTTLGNEALGEMDEPPRRPDPSMSCRCTSQGRLIESPPPMLGRAASHRRSPPPRPTDAEEDAESLSTPPGRAGRVAVAACPRASLPLASSPVRRRHLQRQTRRTRDTPKCWNNRVHQTTMLRLPPAKQVCCFYPLSTLKSALISNGEGMDRK